MWTATPTGPSIAPSHEGVVDAIIVATRVREGRYQLRGRDMVRGVFLEEKLAQMCRSGGEKKTVIPALISTLASRRNVLCVHASGGENTDHSLRGSIEMKHSYGDVFTPSNDIHAVASGTLASRLLGGRGPDHRAKAMAAIRWIRAARPCHPGLPLL